MCATCRRSARLTRATGASPLRRGFPGIARWQRAVGVLSGISLIRQIRTAVAGPELALGPQPVDHVVTVGPAAREDQRLT
jgi:hypothetical protein